MRWALITKQVHAYRKPMPRGKELLGQLVAKQIK